VSQLLLSFRLIYSTPPNYAVIDHIILLYHQASLSFPIALLMGSSTHQAKRPYAGTYCQGHGQSTITSYFSPLNSGSFSYSLGPYQPNTNPTRPSLPESVQADLISVGMRIRKSVPEGYKTGGYSAFKLFSDHSAPAPPLRSIGERSSYRNVKRELIPLCGILKVGGFAQQELVSENSLEEDEDEEDDQLLGQTDVPDLSSQSSTISNCSVSIPDKGKNGNKRYFDEDEGDPDTEVFQNTEIWEDKALELSPKSKPVGRRWVRSGSNPDARALAVPKSKRKWNGTQQDLAVSGNGGTPMMGQGDFTEADFLDYEALTGRGDVQMDDA
jgi:hypothetical protein